MKRSISDTQTPMASQQSHKTKKADDDAECISTEEDDKEISPKELVEDTGKKGSKKPVSKRKKAEVDPNKPKRPKKKQQTKADVEGLLKLSEDLNKNLQEKVTILETRIAELNCEKNYHAKELEQLEKNLEETRASCEKWQNVALLSKGWPVGSMEKRPKQQRKSDES
jgi:hypothetical protein